MGRIEAILISLVTKTNGITAVPSSDVVFNLKMLAKVLTQVEMRLGHTVTPVLGWVTPDRNSTLKCPLPVEFEDGRACHFVCDDFGTPTKICKELKADRAGFDLVCNVDHEFTRLVVPPLGVEPKRMVDQDPI